MANTNYRVWAWGNPVGTGASASLYVGIAGVAKTRNAQVPATVANELICAELGHGICLPVPPGFLVEKQGDPYYVSLDFNLSGQSLPPADPKAVVTAQPRLAAGIVLFDLWIANQDRHGNNLAYDSVQDKVSVFDHSHAFMFGQNGVAWLKALGNAITPGGHCLAPHLPSFAHMQEWFDRINNLPMYWIEHAVDGGVGVGLDAADRDFAVSYLAERRKHLRDMVMGAPQRFPLANAASWS